mgnify:CR=1 FL=1
MELYDTIHCKCGCKYEVNQNITTDKISFPNCGTEYEHSRQKLWYMLVLFSGDLLILLRGDYTLVTKLSDLFLRVQMQVEKSLNFLKHHASSLSNHVSVISAVYITCASIRSC